jgi:hypothetical protein
MTGQCVNKTIRHGNKERVIYDNIMNRQVLAFIYLSIIHDVR